MQQRKGAGCLNAMDEMSIGELLDHIVGLCSSLEMVCDTGGGQARADDVLTLLEQERSALLALEQRMDTALAAGEVPVDLQVRLDELEEAHRKCQAALHRRCAVTRVALRELSSLQAGHRSYHEQEP